MLLYIMAAVLALLWMLDAFLTVHVLKKKGDEKESNDLMRGIYRRGVGAFVATKIFILVFVLAVLFILSIGYLITVESVMFIFIYVYAKVDWHNYKIWKNRNSNGKQGKKRDLSFRSDR